VRVSVTVSCKNTGAKAPRTAGENLVKPAAVKIARMCSEAAVQGCATKQQCRAK